MEVTNYVQEDKIQPEEGYLKLLISIYRNDNENVD